MRYVLTFIVVCSINSVFGQITSTAQLLDAMQTKNRNSWFKEFTFTQQTIRYDQNGAVRDTAIWYEAISYPDLFRIDYNETGRIGLFRNDSTYRYDDYRLVQSGAQAQEFLLFKGGLYFISPNAVVSKLKQYGYDVSKFREDRLNGKRAYVVGADKGDLKTKQFWLDAENFYILRRISQTGNGAALDVQYSDHTRRNGGWVEQTVTFYIDGRLLQVERYLDIDANARLNKSIFNPKSPLKDWFKKN